MNRDATRESPAKKRHDSPDNGETVVFLGTLMSRAEYEMACRNLREYFDLLRSWQEGTVDEPSEQ